MNFFQKKVQKRKQSDLQKADRLIQLSNWIIGKIGVNPKDVKEPFRLNAYNIVSTTRRLPVYGWTDLFEIIPKEYGESVGYSNTINPPYITPDGTRTINLPPEDIISDAKAEIEFFLKK